jgi:hypothetical protein
MIIALIGYVGTMVAALAVLIVVWHNVLGPPQVETVHQQPHLIGAVISATVPVKSPGPSAAPVNRQADDGAAAASTDDARLAAKAVAAERAKRLKVAQRRKEQLARQRDDQQFSAALGYNQEPSQEPSAPRLFDVFGSRRF